MEEATQEPDSKDMLPPKLRVKQGDLDLAETVYSSSISRSSSTTPIRNNSSDGAKTPRSRKHLDWDLEYTSLKRRRPGLPSDLHVSVHSGSSSNATSPCSAPTVSDNLGEVSIGAKEPRSAVSNGKRGLCLRPDLELVLGSMNTPEKSGKGEAEEKNECTKVEDYLYLGSLASLSHKNMSEFGITAVINCSGRHDKKTFDLIGKVGPGVHQLTLCLRDKPSHDISCTFFTALEFIDKIREKGGRVLVFCTQGISRSATIVMAYLMWKKKWNYQQVLPYLRGMRSRINPNLGFCIQLRAWGITRPSVLSKQHLSVVYRIRVSDGRSSLSLGCSEGVPNMDNISLTNGGSSRVDPALALACGPIQDINRSMFLESHSDSIEPKFYAGDTNDARPEEEDEDSFFLVDKENHGARCWLICSPLCQYVWFSSDTPRIYLDAAEIVTNQLISLENAPSRIEYVKAGHESLEFWQAVATANSKDVVVSPTLRANAKLEK